MSEIISEENKNELLGRMMECIDIERGIESGQFKSLNDVLKAVKKRSQSINKALTTTNC